MWAGRHPRRLADGVHFAEGDGSDLAVMEQAGVGGAVGLSPARSTTPPRCPSPRPHEQSTRTCSAIGRQNGPAHAPLFRVMALGSLVIPTEPVAHEAYAHLSTPMLWRFLEEMPAQGDEWTARLVAELRHPEARHTELEALALLVVRGGQSFLTPRPDLVLAPGDELLLAGQP